MRKLPLRLLALALVLTRPAISAEVIETTERTIVELTLAHSRTIENAARQRAADRQDLVVAVDKFRPDLVLSGTLSWAGQVTDPRGAASTSDRQRGYGTDLSIVQKLPIGTDLTIGGFASGQDATGTSPSDSASLGVQLSAFQPLLRGRGQPVNRASVTVAQLLDASSQLAYEQTVIDTLTIAVLTYRSLIRAQRQQEIARRSLESAQRRLANNRELVASGRVAQSELIQNETEIASREVDVSIAANALDSARLRLLDILDLDRDVELTPQDELSMPSIELDLDEVTTLALRLRTDYGRARNALEVARHSHLLVRDDNRWDVGLGGQLTATLAETRFQPLVGSPATTTGDWRIELALQRLFGDRTRQQRLIQSQASVAIFANQVEDVAQTIRLQVRDAVRDVELRVRQVELARTALSLAERQIEIEEKKLAYGRTSSFNVIRFQEDLVVARERELFAEIDAVNAGTRLDQVLGTTLERWQIDVAAKERRDATRDDVHREVGADRRRVGPSEPE